MSHVRQLVLSVVACFVGSVTCVLPSAAQAPDHAAAGQQVPADTGSEFASDSDRGSADSKQRGSWRSGNPRWFTATRTDVGFLFLRPRFSFGFGRPHFRWWGVDANPIVSTSGIAGYLGLRVAHPNIDLRLGGRYARAFTQSLLEPRKRFTHLDVESRAGPRSTYLSLESELTYDLPLGPGSIIGEIAGTYVSMVEQGYYVFEQTIRVVADPPLVWRKRLGYALPLGFRRAIKIALLTEVVAVPKRDMFVFRAGGSVSLRMSASWQARAFAIPVIFARDELGADGGDSFRVGLRHYWATGL